MPGIFIAGLVLAVFGWHKEQFPVVIAGLALAVGALLL